MVLPESADTNLISRTSSTANFQASASSLVSALPKSKRKSPMPSSPSKTSAKLISYNVTTEQPDKKTFADRVPAITRPLQWYLWVCCGNNMKWFSFPLCCALSFGLFLAFSRASTVIQISNKGYNHYMNNRRLSDGEPDNMPGKHGGGGGIGGALFGTNRERFQHVWPAGMPMCDCSKCLEREDIYNPGNPHYRTLIKHGLQHYYGHQAIALQMSHFVPHRRQLWRLGFALYMTASQICVGKYSKDVPLLAVVLVISKPGHVERRHAIRRTWGSVNSGQKWPKIRTAGDARVVFVMGTSNEQQYNDVMLEEANTYGDMVLVEVKEQDKNSKTKKVLSGMKWAITYCHHAKHIIKVEDHVFFDLPRVLDVLASQQMANMIYGKVVFVRMVPREQSKAKNFVSYEAYPLDWFPPYTVDDFYVMPRNLSKRMLNVAMNVPYLNIENIFITGILAKVFDARHMDIHHGLFDSNGVSGAELCDFVNRRKMVITDVSPEMANSFWRRIQHPEMCGV